MVDNEQTKTGEAYMRPLTPQQAAEWCGLHVNTIRKACHRGELGTKCGLKYLIGQRELAVWAYGRDAEDERVA